MAFGIALTSRLSSAYQTQIWEIEYIAVLHRHKRVLRLSPRAWMDRRAATISQFQMAGDEVCMEVGQKDVTNLKAQSLGVGEILLDVALRIDNNRSRGRFISE